MDQDSMVTDRLDGGQRLVDRLRQSGFEVGAAFWARPTEEGRWYLYLATPGAERDIRAAYRTVLTAVRGMPELGIDPFEVRVVGPGDSMARAAAEVIRPVPATGPFAVPDPKPYPGRTRFNGPTLGGVGVDGAYIYPPPVASA